MTPVLASSAEGGILKITWTQFTKSHFKLFEMCAYICMPTLHIAYMYVYSVAGLGLVRIAVGHDLRCNLHRWHALDTRHCCIICTAYIFRSVTICTFFYCEHNMCVMQRASYCKKGRQSKFHGVHLIAMHCNKMHSMELALSACSGVPCYHACGRQFCWCAKFC